LATPQGQHNTLRTSHLKGGHKTKKVLSHGPSIKGVLKKMSPQVSQAQLSCPPKDIVVPESLSQPECPPFMKKREYKYGVDLKDRLPKNKFIPSPNCVLNPVGLPLRPVRTIFHSFTLSQLKVLLFCGRLVLTLTLPLEIVSLLIDPNLTTKHEEIEHFFIMHINILHLVHSSHL
jgi:hypothetical protein